MTGHPVELPCRPFWLLWILPSGLRFCPSGCIPLCSIFSAQWSEFHHVRRRGLWPQIREEKQWKTQKPGNYWAAIKRQSPNPESKNQSKTQGESTQEEFPGCTETISEEVGSWGEQDRRKSWQHEIQLFGKGERGGSVGQRKHTLSCPKISRKKKRKNST